jgi:hypothetical protein
VGDDGYLIPQNVGRQAGGFVSLSVAFSLRRDGTPAISPRLGWNRIFLDSLQIRCHNLLPLFAALLLVIAMCASFGELGQRLYVPGLGWIVNDSN